MALSPNTVTLGAKALQILGGGHNSVLNNDNDDDNDDDDKDDGIKGNINCIVTHPRQYCNCCLWIISFNFHNNPMKQILLLLLSPFTEAQKPHKETHSLAGLQG